ncbi:hypothetical protein N7470_008297 [Penicillium chermesinum]|nr:hypothetical protein N7470_008297 [Penicillium chermesinum]
MSSTNFAAAQERVLERRRLREAEARARRAEQQRASPINPATVQRLPYPLNRLPDAGWSLWNTVKGREGTRPAFRVGQVDAELLDEELLGLLKGQHQLREDWSHEIQFVLRALLFKLSIWDHNASYGAALQGLQYTDSRSKGPVHSPPTKVQKSLYGLLTVGGRYAWDKWESWLIGQEGGYEEPSQDMRMLSRITDFVSTTHSIAAFIESYASASRHHLPKLVERFPFEYLNRQLVWHAFTEFLLFLLPLVGIGRWRRWISRAWRKTVTTLKASGEDEDQSEKQGELAHLPERTCAICYRDQNPAVTTESDVLAASASAGGITGSAQTDVTNPYETIPCGCIYCFVCIVQKIEAEEGQGWVCLRCGEIVKKCQPWNGDVLQEARSLPGTGKIVGFAMDEETDPKETIQSNEKSGKTSPLEELSSDEALQHSSEWSTEDNEPAEHHTIADDKPSSEHIQ